MVEELVPILVEGDRLGGVLDLDGVGLVFTVGDPLAGGGIGDNAKPIGGRSEVSEGGIDKVQRFARDRLL